jgi:hypothetical protein
MKFLAKALALGVAFVAAAPLVYAVPLTGTIITLDSVTVAANGAVTFSNPGSVGTAAQGSAPTGSFAGLAGDAVTFTNFNYNSLATPFTLYTGTDATLGAFSFVLTSGSCNSNPNFTQYFNCFGTGTMSLGTFTPTVVNYALGVNQSGTLNFSETNVTVASAATPEPSSLLMLGTGLVSAAGMMIRRRRIA